QLDVLVVPSLPTPGWVEQFGRVAVEAMASGVPVIASRSGALPDVVSGAGLLVEPADAQALRQALAEAAQPQRWPPCGRPAWPAAASSPGHRSPQPRRPSTSGPWHPPNTVRTTARTRPSSPRRLWWWP